MNNSIQFTQLRKDKEKFKNIFKKYLTKQEAQAIMKSQQRNKHPKKQGGKPRKGGTVQSTIKLRFITL